MDEECAIDPVKAREEFLEESPVSLLSQKERNYSTSTEDKYDQPNQNEEESSTEMKNESAFVLSQNESCSTSTEEECNLPYKNEEGSSTVMKNEESLPVLNQNEEGDSTVMKNEETGPVLNQNEEGSSTVMKNESTFILSQHEMVNTSLENDYTSQPVPSNQNEEEGYTVMKNEDCASLPNEDEDGDSTEMKNEDENEEESYTVMKNEDCASLPNKNEEECSTEMKNEESVALLNQNERENTSLKNDTSLPVPSNQNEEEGNAVMENESAPVLSQNERYNSTSVEYTASPSVPNQNEESTEMENDCTSISSDQMMLNSQEMKQSGDDAEVAVNNPQIVDAKDLISPKTLIIEDISHTVPVSESTDKSDIVINNSPGSAFNQDSHISSPVTMVSESDQLKESIAMRDGHLTSLINVVESPAVSLPKFEEPAESKTESSVSHLEGRVPTTTTTTSHLTSSSNSEQKVKKGVKRKKPSASKGIQTSMHLDSVSNFRDRVVDLEALKSETGVVCVDSLQDLDVSLEEWPMLLVNQLQLRDVIINNLNSVICELVECGQVLEQDLDYLKLKILELQQEAKRRAKNDQQNHKSKGKESESQTTEEELNEAWSRWYYGRWGDYYSESDPTSAMYWPGHYTQQATVVSKESKDEKTQQRVDSEVQEVDTGEQNEDVTTEGGNLKEKSRDESFSEKPETDCTDKRKTLKAKRRGKHKSKKLRSEEKDIKASERTKNEDKSKEESASDQISESPVSIEPSQELTTGTNASQKLDGWDTSQSITQQVASAAAQAVVDSGYVFQEEYGLYYDYNTGYYYNAEDGLYYDTKSGTYFYYDHASQSYQFHSQVTSSSNNSKRSKRKTAKEKSSKSSNKDEDTDKEEGECSDSEEEQDDEELDSEKEQIEEGDLTSPDHQEEDAPAVGEIPPSLRLMVVEGGDKVGVGMLHMVTLNGGTVGREALNDVHLPDISVSKIHAKIKYSSSGPEDHHYYIRDLGSMNGTYVSGSRLSDAHQVSEEVEIGHGWELQFGSIKVKCHLHPGNLTCNECEPGLVLQSLPSGSLKTGKGITSFKNAKSKEKARRKELKAMQKKYKLTHRDPQPSSAPAPGYTDRTLRRQVEKGSDNPYEKTEVASCDVPLRKDSRGYALLQKMGWSHGQGLGKSNTGIKEPVQPVGVVGQAGLGSSHFSASALSNSDPREVRKKKQLQITQERYQQFTAKR